MDKNHQNYQVQTQFCKSGNYIMTVPLTFEEISYYVIYFSCIWLHTSEIVWELKIFMYETHLPGEYELLLTY
jgi:hypothetical protein